MRKCDWQKKWKKHQQRGYSCQGAWGGGMRRCGACGGLSGVTSLNYPKALPSVGTLTRFRYKWWVLSSTEDPWMSFVLGRRLIVLTCKWLMCFCLLTSDAHNSRYHKKTQNSKGKQPAVAIRASEQAWSFNPRFRWVSPIHSANPRWNATVYMSAPLRYRSLDAASRTKPTAFASRYRRCSVTVWRCTKMADRCWVYRGKEEEGGGMETPDHQFLPVMQQGEDNRSLQVRSPMPGSIWGQGRLPHYPLFPQNTPPPPRIKALLRCNLVFSPLSVLLLWHYKVSKIFIIHTLLQKT